MPNEYKNYNEYSESENYNENLGSENEDSREHSGDSQDDYVKLSDEYSLPSSSLSKSQKIGVISLAFFALFVVILWSIQFKNSINQPFNRSSQGSTEDQAGTCSDGSCQSEDSEASLKAKDTDKDGLSDWDELNIYNTSPYLEDSDSDGFSDKNEIDSDNDPNCPAGRDCYDTSTLAGEDSENTETLSEDGNLTELLNNQTTSIDNQNLDSLPNIQDAASLRQLLLDSGVEKELLDVFSDEELMQTFLEMSQEGK